MARITLVYFDAGGGHRSSMNALRAAIEREQHPWELRPLNLQELLDRIDPFLKLTKIRLQDVYNRMIERGLTLGTPQLLPALHGLIRAFHRPAVRVLEDFWRKEQPDMVVSLVPNFNRAIGQSVRRALPEIPYVTILTDLADYPPHFWMERESQYLVCGTERAVEQASKLGHDRAHIFRTSGMLLNPRFYQPVEVDREVELRKLRLDPARPTGLMLFGGQGSRVMRPIAAQLDRAGLPVQLIAICGHNQKLEAALRAMPRRMPMFVEGFTKEVPYYMRLADFFIGKPGPASISEAIVVGLPVIVECNAWTLPQERYNARWILEQQVGMVLPHFRRIDRAVARLLEPETLAGFRTRAAAISIRAVFEVPGILAKILAGHARGSA